MFPRQTHSACSPFVHQGASSSDCPAKDVAAFRAPSDLSRRLDNSCNVLYSPNKTSASKEGGHERDLLEPGSQQAARPAPRFSGDWRAGRPGGHPLPPRRGAGGGGGGGGG